MKRFINFFFLFITSASFAQTANFSGKYVLDKAKTDFGQAPQWIIPKAIEVKQGKDSVRFTRVGLDTQMNEHPYTETLPFDGEAITTNVAFTQSQRTSSLVWTADKQSFTLKIDGSRDGAPISSATEEWSLLDGGKLLLVDRHVVMPNGFSYENKGYYDRQ